MDAMSLGVGKQGDGCKSPLSDGAVISGLASERQGEVFVVGGECLLVLLVVFVGPDVTRLVVNEARM